MVTFVGDNPFNFSPIISRLVPFFVMCILNSINIPIMRYQELSQGTTIYDKSNNKLGYSRIAAFEGISQVILCRNFMSVPSLGITPIVVNHLDKRGLLQRYKWLNVTSHASLVGFCYLIATPLACAIFSQTAEIPVSRLERTLQHDLLNKYGSKLPDIVIYNKGL